MPDNNNSSTSYERVFHIVAGIVTIIGFLYNLEIQNYLNIGFPNFSEYSLFVRSTTWILAEGFFAIGFAYVLIKLSTMIVVHYSSGEYYPLFLVPIFAFTVFISAWQTIIFVEHFFDTSNLNGPTWFWATLFRNVLAYIYSFGILMLHKDLTERASATNSHSHDNKNGPGNTQSFDNSIKDVRLSTFDWLNIGLFAFTSYTIMYWILAVFA